MECQATLEELDVMKAHLNRLECGMMTSSCVRSLFQAQPPAVHQSTVLSGQLHVSSHAIVQQPNAEQLFSADHLLTQGPRVSLSVVVATCHCLLVLPFAELCMYSTDVATAACPPKGPFTSPISRGAPYVNWGKPNPTLQA
eukprot:1161829-Pelagomonas_calceolata.AAC.9